MDPKETLQAIRTRLEHNRAIDVRDLRLTLLDLVDVVEQLLPEDGVKTRRSGPAKA